MRRIRRLLAEIESTLNISLKRITLKEALEGKLPAIMPSGEPHYLAYSDILELSEVVPKELWDKVYLPITLVRRVDLGPGVFVIPRDDQRLLEILLGEKKSTLSKPEVNELASRYPSLIHILILGSDLE